MNENEPLQELLERVQQVIAATTDNFLELVRIAGLEPARDLAGANLSGVDLSGVNLTGADLSFANLSNSNLSGANLYKVDLSGANLQGADLGDASFSKDNLMATHLGGTIYQLDVTTSSALTLYMIPVAAGFPSPAEDYIESKIDLNQHLIRHPAATFFVRVAGDSMIGAGINSGDLLIVDRSVEPTEGSVVIAAVNGELTVKRLHRDGERLLLVAENESYYPLEVNEHTDFQIWGVVTNVIHSL